jgi:hypothetical protein
MILKTGNYEKRLAALMDLRETKSKDSAIVNLLIQFRIFFKFISLPNQNIWLILSLIC